MTSRRPVCILLALTVPLITTCGDNDEEQPAELARPVSGEFVGQVADGAEYVAVVADRPRGSGERKVRAYVCDGESTGEAEWYKGSSAGNSFSLRSVTGQTRIKVSLKENSARGAVTLAGGKVLSFSANRAVKGAGLYHVRQTADGLWFGRSEGGARIRARDRSGRRVIGKVRLPDGETVDYKVRQVPGSGGPDRYTAIVLPPRGVKGRGGAITAGQPSSRIYTAAF